MEAKYKIGDVLKTIVNNKISAKLHVIEVIISSCYAGTQVSYNCRAHTPTGISTALIALNEVEVMEWQENKDND